MARPLADSKSVSRAGLGTAVGCGLGLLGLPVAATTAGAPLCDEEGAPARTLAVATTISAAAATAVAIFCVRIMRPEPVRFWLCCEALNRKTVNQVIGVFRSPIERNYDPAGTLLGKHCVSRLARP